MLDRALKLYENSPWKPLRKTALRRSREWMVERLERSEGLGTIYPAMMNSIFALVAESSDLSDPLLAREIQFLARYEIEEDDSIRVQPCISPLWDTAIAMVSLEEAGLDPAHPSLLGAARWLVANQILGPGDWQVKNRKAQPGGWAFEFRNDFYPDVDDTAFVLMALSRVSDPESARLHGAIRRGLAWLAEHAERRRRLGRIRPRKQSGLPEPHSVRRSQRHAGSIDGRRDGARRGMSRAHGLARDAPSDRDAPVNSSTAIKPPTAPGSGAGV